MTLWFLHEGGFQSWTFVLARRLDADAHRVIGLSWYFVARGGDNVRAAKSRVDALSSVDTQAP